MLNRANIPTSDRYAMVIKLDMISVVEVDGIIVMRYLHWSGTVPKFAKHLRTWGETGTVTLKTGFTPKHNNALNHDGDCY